MKKKQKNISINDFTKDDLMVARALEDYLGINIPGVPTSTKYFQEDNLKPSSIPYLPDLDAEIFRHNTGMMQTIVLSGLIHGNNSQKKKILSSIQSKHFWEKSFRNYLFDIISKQLSQEGNISIQDIQNSIPSYTKVVYGYEPSSRNLFGDYYTWAQILKIKHTQKQISQAVKLIKEISQIE